MFLNKHKLLPYIEHNGKAWGKKNVQENIDTVLSRERAGVQQAFYLACQWVESHKDWSMCPWSKLLQAKSTTVAALQGDWPKWSTPRIFHCSHIWTQMLDTVSVAFFIYIPINTFLVKLSSNILST